MNSRLSGDVEPLQRAQRSLEEEADKQAVAESSGNLVLDLSTKGPLIEDEAADYSSCDEEAEEDEADEWDFEEIDPGLMGKAFDDNLQDVLDVLDEAERIDLQQWEVSCKSQAGDRVDAATEGPANNRPAKATKELVARLCQINPPLSSQDSYTTSNGLCFRKLHKDPVERVKEELANDHSSPDEAKMYLIHLGKTRAANKTFMLSESISLAVRNA